jgi:hypothetical protein
MRRQASAELATVLDAGTLFDLKQRNAAHATRLLATADRNVSAFPPKQIGTLVDRFL